MLNRESKHNRGLLRTNSQVQVANRSGDVVGTNATRTVANASKDACHLIVADWKEHPRSPVASDPLPASNDSSTSPAVPAVTPTSANSTASAKLHVDSAPPGADIEVDGSFIGNTPSDVQLAEGDHMVVVKKTGFRDWERKLKVTGGSSVQLNAELEKAAAQ